MSAPSTVSILDGSTFVVSDGKGDIESTATDTKGLFHQDTRHLSQWVLTVNGNRLQALSTDDLEYFATQFFLVASTGTIYVDATLSVVRQRAVGDGFHEDLRVLNHAEKPCDLDIHIAAASDFADLFEVKDALTKKGEYYQRREDGRLVLGYRRERFVRETSIVPGSAAAIEEHALRFTAHIEPHGQWTTGIDVTMSGLRGTRQREDGQAGRREPPAIKKDLTAWLAAPPRLSCEWEPLEQIYRRSLVDLAALRFTSTVYPEYPLPAAGLPWFM